ncbi:protein lifeguard 1-like isoform X2 [Eriocheir sinensis]|nr:protein lifeguard 1-like isoform X2 [Eriocheir sinensis]
MADNMYEMGEQPDFDFSDKSIRRGFIRKVYAVLTCQLIVTFGIIAVFVLVPEVNDYAYHHSELFWSAFGISIALILILGCCSGFRRKTPFNYIALILFTLCEGYLLGCVAATYSASEVLVAIGITIVVSVGLTIFAFQTKWDFTLKGGLLFVLLLVLITFGIIAGIMNDKVVNIVYASLGALLFSFYLVFDTQLMLGGNHKLAISPEEYIFAALNLYLDVVNLFLYILALVGRD